MVRLLPLIIGPLLAIEGVVSALAWVPLTFLVAFGGQGEERPESALLVAAAFALSGFLVVGILLAASVAALRGADKTDYHRMRVSALAGGVIFNVLTAVALPNVWPGAVMVVGCTAVLTIAVGCGVIALCPRERLPDPEDWSGR